MKPVITMIIALVLGACTTTLDVSDLMKPQVALGPDAPDRLLTINDIDELQCMTQNIFHEAGIEAWEGKMAVAQVVINRVKSDRFPNTVCGVIQQSTRHEDGRIVCQFSWWCDADKRNYRPIDSLAWRQSEWVATQVLLRGQRWDKFNDVYFYHAVYVDPNWPFEEKAVVGNHIFYKRSW